ncbi:glycosyltransferase family 2 protein [Listeria ivanovii]|uniref:Putative galactosamine-containing minor teichoic acid biosynthesis protein GgaA n=1 Tax=Listeria ivanovii (strain ATCC BAA-678 / PAM 55) TaxID=881621 RepID=G2ZEK7_LISIP|nr:glycosyltransferase family 2 protein [Listeria ivanovii]AHI55582.1 glycosyltransferase [Listeria ivanovii WSLC3009]AIS65037.1 glycosyltransferase [Listeria ivanovii subsp. ivanovii]MBC1758247.1 glycosyltransferase family 2 protein [Listeria ivanovii]MBK3913124.1 glycosyltransferase family 2 protein [Listeria ivanovii subsp. ivanovii]MBK3920759.1 glycosyltransferase family 2 protein [Listeria ivanovii subsp. ivanovii]
MKFAIIIPFYNAEKRLGLSVDSIIKQSYSFLKHVEILLINDGSTDGSGMIAKRYAEKYPNNIRLLEVPNGGPAKARNIGIHNVRENTDFVGFLDADDILSSNMLDDIAAFLNQSEVNMVVPAFYYLDDFGKKQKIAPHKLNDRFKDGNRVVNIEEEPQAIHFYIGGTFLRFESLKEFSFDESLYFGEDQLLITQFLLKHRTYGLIADAGYYYYRDMKQKGSLVSSSWKNSERYTPFLKKVYQTYITNSEAEFGTVIPYIKTLIAYHAKLFFYKENVYFKEVLSEAEQRTFVVELQQILKCVGATTILALDTPLVVKEMMLSIMRQGWPVQFETEPLNEIPLVSVREVYRLGKPAVVELLLEEQRQSLPNEGQFVLDTSFGEIAAKLISRKSDQKIWDIVVREAGSMERAVFKLKPFQNKVVIYYKDQLKKTSIVELRVMNSLFGKVKRNIKLKRDFK